MDAVLICLLVLLGATIANLVDTVFSLTPRLAEWLKKMFEPEAL
jgi:hypothetical protein